MIYIVLHCDGLVKYFMRSKNPNAEFFQDWAEEKLFSHQMGTSVERETLAADLLKIPIDKFRTIMKAQVGKINCIYLIELGLVADLIPKYSIPSDVHDEKIVYKYGFTEDLMRRVKEHMRDYGKIINKPIYVTKFAHIDSQYTSRAETDIKNTFQAFGASIEACGNKELVALNAVELNEAVVQYANIGGKYSGKSEELRNEVRKLNEDMVEMMHKLSISQKDRYCEQNSRECEIALLKMRLESESEKFKIILKNSDDSISLIRENASLSIQIREMRIESLEQRISRHNVPV